MLGDALVKVAREFADSSQQPFKDNSLAIFIRQEWPQIVSQAIGHLQSNYKIVASPGKGRWSEAPWLALLDPIVCDSPEYGYYPVYLFSPDWSSVYLTMGQGTTAIRREFSKKEAVMVLRQQGELLRARVPEFSKNFSVGPFDLGATEQKKDVWASGPAWGTSYQVDQMPDDAKLKADLLEMLHLYQLANYRGGTAAVEEVAQDDNEDSSKPEIDGVRRERLHYKIERVRNRKLVSAVKKYHGCKCQACGFDFEKVYGAFAKNYIEAHHLIPLSKLSSDEPPLLNPKTDFAVLCANFHRMIHAQKCPPLEDFKKHVSQKYARMLRELT